MFLANINEVPEYFYVFIGYGNQISDWVNAHNFSISKRLVSSGMSLALDENKRMHFLRGDIDYLPFSRTKTTTNAISAFVAKIVNNYNIEHNLEVYRKANHKEYPSRLSALYAFGDYETCVKVSQRYGWKLSQVKKFKLNQDVLPFVKIGRFNMEIVSLLRTVDASTLSVENQEMLYNRYWNCVEDRIGFQGLNGKVLECDCIHEYLIEGILELVE